MKKTQSKLFISKEQLIEFYKDFDEYCAKYEKPCKLGCVACCKQYVSLFNFEVIHIKKEIKKLPPSVREQVRKNYLEYLPYFLDNVPGKSFYYHDLFETTNNYSRRHAINRFPCPLLIDNSHCAIYNNRPIVCRLHFVKDQPELCEKMPLRDPAIESLELQSKFTDFLCSLGKWHLVPLIYPLRDLFDKKQKLPNINYKIKPDGV